MLKLKEDFRDELVKYLLTSSLPSRDVQGISNKLNSLEIFEENESDV